MKSPGLQRPGCINTRNGFTFFGFTRDRDTTLLLICDISGKMYSLKEIYTYILKDTSSGDIQMETVLEFHLKGFQCNKRRKELDLHYGFVLLFFMQDRWGKLHKTITENDAASLGMRIRNGITRLSLGKISLWDCGGKITKM